MVSVKLLVEGGNMKPGPTVAQQLGPMGINMGKVISDVNEKSKSFKGMTVPIVIEIDPKTRAYTIVIKSPPTSELLKKEAGAAKGSGARLKLISGNIAFERIIAVALQKHDNMLSNDLLDSIKSVLGTCQAMGIVVDSHEIKDVMIDLNDGKYDAMIKAQKTEVDSKKALELKTYFDIVTKKQTAESAAAAALEDEKAKTAAANAAAKPATGSAPAKAGAKAADKPAAKPAAKGKK